MGGRALRKLFLGTLLAGLTTWVSAQSFRVQCPVSTITHPNPINNNSEPAYTGSTTWSLGTNGYYTPTGNVNGAIKCQQISGGDGYSTMANGTQTYMFSFGPLSGLADIANGQPGTQFPSVFNTVAPGNLVAGDPATTTGPATGTPLSYDVAAFSYNGAVGLAAALDNGGAIDGHVDPRPIMD